MAKLTTKLLERYHDGELSSREAREVERLLAEFPAEREALLRMERLGEMVRLMSAETSADVSLEGFEQRVVAKLREPSAVGVFERLGVWAQEFIEHRRVVWIPAAAAVGVAVAVALALPFVRSEPQSLPVAPPAGGIWMASDEQPDTISSSTVESASFGDVQGSRYDVPDGRGGTVGVVWVVEQP